MELVVFYLVLLGRSLEFMVCPSLYPTTPLSETVMAGDWGKSEV
jgi:hypothetical protein